MTAIRLSPELKASIDRWREAQPDKPSRSEAVRRLVERGLVAEENAPAVSSKLADDLGRFA